MNDKSYRDGTHDSGEYKAEWPKYTHLLQADTTQGAQNTPAAWSKLIVTPS
jgi:hypothetical protein